MSNLQGYGRSMHGNFMAVETEHRPHRYKVTKRQLVYITQEHQGVITPYSIEASEYHGMQCGHGFCKKKYRDHKEVVVINCMRSIVDGREELVAYIKLLEPKMIRDGYHGYMFKKAYKTREYKKS